MKIYSEYTSITRLTSRLGSLVLLPKRTSTSADCSNTTGPHGSTRRCHHSFSASRSLMETLPRKFKKWCQMGRTGTSTAYVGKLRKKSGASCLLPPELRRTLPRPTPGSPLLVPPRCSFSRFSPSAGKKYEEKPKNAGEGNGVGAGGRERKKRR